MAPLALSDLIGPAYDAPLADTVLIDLGNKAPMADQTVYDSPVGEPFAKLTATRKAMIMANQRIRGKNFSLYLGTPVMREVRIEKLNALAAQFGLPSISRLIESIADGDLSLQPVLPPPEELINKTKRPRPPL